MAGHLLEERVTSVSSVVTRGYVYVEDELLGVVDRGSVNRFAWVHVDHLRTPIAATSGEPGGPGNAVWRASYSPFGIAVIDDDPDADSQAFALDTRMPGQRWDAESGLHYNFYRTYDPRLGTFLEADPIGMLGGSNLYAYAKGNPINFGDPLGLSPIAGSSTGSWCHWHFIFHYYFGGGTPVNLGSIGLLAAFRNSPSVIASMQNFRSLVASQAGAQARALCAGKCAMGTRSTTFSVNDRGETDVTLDGCLFSIGGSTLFRNAACSVIANCDRRTYSFGCNLGFSIRDWFRDPADLGFETGGTPYRINGGWGDVVAGGGGTGAI